MNDRKCDVSELWHGESIHLYLEVDHAVVTRKAATAKTINPWVADVVRTVMASVVDSPSRVGSYRQSSEARFPTCVYL